MEVYISTIYTEHVFLFYFIYYFRCVFFFGCFLFSLIKGLMEDIFSKGTSL